MKISGIAARNNKGHFGNPPGTRISPQSHTVPSTIASPTTSTPSCCVSGLTSTPNNDDVDLLSELLVLCVSPLTDSLPSADTGSCASVLTRNSTKPCEGSMVCTTLLIGTESARTV